MFILDNQKCKNCGGSYSIVSHSHFKSQSFPWTPFCSKQCEEEFRKKWQKHPVEEKSEVE